MEQNRISTSSKRLKELMEYYNLTQADMSRRVGIPRATLCRFVNGEHEPKQDWIYAISSSYGIDPAWLMGFDVSMKKVQVDSIDTDAVTELTLGKYSHLWKSVEKLMKLKKVDQERVVDLIDTLYQKGV